MSNFNRWIRSKQGLATIAGAVVLVLLVAVVGSFAGWWDALGLTGAAGVPTLPKPSFPAPQDGATCLPTCETNDGKFLAHPGSDIASFNNEPVVVWIGVPGQFTAFDLEIFDGDSALNGAGQVDRWGGYWDEIPAEAVYKLYADPMKSGSEAKLVGEYRGNALKMPDNNWYKITTNVSNDAKAPSGHYFYRLETYLENPGRGINAFKLRSNAYLSTGSVNDLNSNYLNAPVGILGQLATNNDIATLYPNGAGSSNYTGNWLFHFLVPAQAQYIEFWDGDFDRGTTAATGQDTDDFNTEGKPAWASAAAKPEAGYGQGAPADNQRTGKITLRGEPVFYNVLDVNGTPIYTNAEPSGTEEWERFSMAAQNAQSKYPNADVYAPGDYLAPGFYTLDIQGLDLHNIVWLRLPICDLQDGCGPPTSEGTCPRTIGYWKNNVDKVLIQNKTNGVQESKETLDWALKNVAAASLIYRTGINIAAPVANPNAVRLTDQEVNTILQRADPYPGDRNSMMARALQQNMAAWLNVGSGKLGENQIITLTLPSGGTFEGTVMQALREAESIILYGGNLERAKDIADQINNGLLGEDATDSVCTDYVKVIPPEKQPPTTDKMPKAPKPNNPPTVDVPPPPDTATCTGRENIYGVEITNNPFEGIKFEYQSGTEVKNGDYDVYEVVMTAEQAAMSSIQMEAKAGENVGMVTLENCNFAQGLCGDPVLDGSGFFAFSLVGSKDNGDGTYTVTFQVTNNTDAGTSHVTIGVVPANPPSTYTSKVCTQ
jgi:hypothetical protein